MRTAEKDLSARDSISPNSNQFVEPGLITKDWQSATTKLSLHNTLRL